MTALPCPWNNRRGRLASSPHSPALGYNSIMRDKQEGVIRILDFCPRFRRHGRLFRPSVLMRLIQPMGGRPRIRLRVKPLFNYGAEQPVCSVGSHHVSYGGEGGHVRVTTDAYPGRKFEGILTVINPDLDATTRARSKARAKARG